MTVIKYFDNLGFNEDVDLTDGAVVAPGMSGGEQDASAENIQSRATSFDDWNFIETKIVSQSGADYVRPDENVVLYARIWNDYTRLFLKRSDIAAISMTFYVKRTRNFAATDWIALDHWRDVAVPVGSVVAMEGDWKYDSDEYNFVWTPDQTEKILCEDEGVYAGVARFDLTNGRVPLFGEFTIVAKAK